MVYFYQKSIYIVKNEHISVPFPSPKQADVFYTGAVLSCVISQAPPVAILFLSLCCPGTAHMEPQNVFREGPSSKDLQEPYFRSAGQLPPHISLEEPQHRHKAWLGSQSLKCAQRKEQCATVPCSNQE